MTEFIQNWTGTAEVLANHSNKMPAKGETNARLSEVTKKEKFGEISKDVAGRRGRRKIDLRRKYVSCLAVPKGQR